MISLSRILAHWAHKHPDAPAVTHDNTTLSWAELDRASNRLARAYGALGVKRNDFVTIALPNGIEFFVATFSTWKLGAVPQPVSAKLPRFEREQITALANPALVVGLPAGEAASVASLPIGFVPDAGLSDADLPEVIGEFMVATTSGGSTGRPKLIVSHRPPTWDPDVAFHNFANGGAMLVPGPLYHGAPFLFARVGLLNGNHVTVTTRFDAEDTLRLVEAHRVDMLYLVPTMMQRIWNLPEATRNRYDLTSLRTIWHMAAPCPSWLKEAFIDWLGPDCIWELYSGTESIGISTISGNEWLAHRGSVGRPNETCEMKIVDEHGATLPAGEIGEVYMRPLEGPGTTYHYVGATARAIEGGWESLGDMGYVDADGYLYITDRRADMILCGGANVYPAEVEAAIDAFPGVRSSAVIGLPHVDLGNAVHAIVDAPTNNVTEAALLAHLRERLVPYKLPRSIEFVSTPLRDDAGKMRRVALREGRLTLNSQ